MRSIKLLDVAEDARPKSWFVSYKFLYSSRTCAGRVKESPIPMPQGRETGVIPRPPSIGARVRWCYRLALSVSFMDCKCMKK